MLLAVAVSILSGVTMVVSRCVNALLARHTSAVASSVWNYVTGLAGSAVLLLVVCLAGGLPALPQSPPPLWTFTGGLVGLTIVTLLNLSVKKISAFYLTLFMFIGQVFTGVVLDILLTGAFSLGNLLGGLAVTVGMAYNLWVDRQAASKAPR